LRYYNLIIGTGGSALNSLSSGGGRFTSHPNGPSNLPDPGALNVEFDITVTSMLRDPTLGFVRVWGISLQDISQAHNLNPPSQGGIGLPILCYGGMGRVLAVDGDTALVEEPNNLAFGHSVRWCLLLSSLTRVGPNIEKRRVARTFSLSECRLPPGEAIRGALRSSTALDPEPTAQNRPKAVTRAASLWALTPHTCRIPVGPAPETVRMNNNSYRCGPQSAPRRR
jgi:hypothetical protein